MSLRRLTNRVCSRSIGARVLRLSVAAAWLLLTLPWFTICAAGQGPKASESEVEAVYVFKFSQFVNWPAQTAASSSLDICVLGDDPIAPFLDKTVHGENVNGRSVLSRHIVRVQDAQGCSILYISRSEASRLPQVLAAVKAWPLLTVSEIPDFVDKGGMIEFVLQSGRVRFEVNLAPASRAGLTFSSELLKVAVLVKGNEQQGSR